MEKDFELLENLETIKLISPEGEEVEFELIAVIAENDKQYAILQPVELLEGMTEDEALVFEVTVEDEESVFDFVDDEAIVDLVFEKYNELLAENEINEEE